MTHVVIVAGIATWLAIICGYGRHRHRSRWSKAKAWSPGMCPNLATCLSFVHRAQCATVDHTAGTAPQILEHAAKPVTHAHWFHPASQQGGAA
jgi:hypothetical protein